jgi:septum formation protein
MHLILASGSPRRRELLRDIWPTFEVRAADLDETLNPELPHLSDQIEELSLRKARAVALHSPEPALILGSDTVVVIEGHLLGKPRDHAEATDMLSRLSNRWHEVITGVALLQTGPTSRHWTTHAVSRVHMRALSAIEIETYVASGEPLDKAGAYAIQGQASAFVTAIEGAWDTIVGLPLAEVRTLLQYADAQ